LQIHLFNPSEINFTNVLRNAFTRADPKSAKKADGLTVFFALLGSVHVQAVRKMLMKLTSDLNDLGFGPYEVNFVDNFALDLKNGEKISINVWFPKSPENYFPKHAATVRYCDAAHNENFIEEVTKSFQYSQFKTVLT